MYVGSSKDQNEEKRVRSEIQYLAWYPEFGMELESFWLTRYLHLFVSEL